MRQPEEDRLERELRDLTPSPFPRELSERLEQAWNRGDQVPAPRQCDWPSAIRRSWLRWLAPAAAAVAAAFALILLLGHQGIRGHATTKTATAPAALNANDVEIDRQLVASFQAVATLPGGEPVRVRCREWMDQVVLRDAARGLTIEQRTPRFEIIPVELETF